MSEPFLGEIKVVSFNFPPKGWAFCNGQLLPINQNQALFSILGTTFGGNGQTTFALPNLQGRVPVHVGTGTFGNNIVLGESAGEAAHTLTVSEMPAHIHTVVASNQAPNAASLAGNTWASKSGNLPYAPTPNTTMSPAAIANTGSSQGHPNLSPYLVLNFVILLSGIFPSRN